jgi:hypothetical protein
MSVDTIAELGEANEPCPDRRKRGGLDRTASQELDKIEDARPEASHPVADGTSRDPLAACDRRGGLMQPRTNGLDHVLHGRRLARERHARKHALLVSAVHACGEAAPDGT